MVNNMVALEACSLILGNSVFFIIECLYVCEADISKCEICFILSNLFYIDIHVFVKRKSNHHLLV